MAETRRERDRAWPRIGGTFPFLLLAACGGEPPAARAGGATAMPTAVGLCVSCHGRDGRAVVRGYPHIGGQDEAYLLEQLLAYRSGERAHAAMQGVVGALDEEELAATAAWYASRESCSDGS